MTNPIEVSTSSKDTRANILEPGEILLGAFIFGRDAEGHMRIHFRALDIAIDRFSKCGPDARSELISCLDRPYAQFRGMLCPPGSLITRCDHGYANPGNCRRCRP